MVTNLLYVTLWMKFLLSSVYSYTDTLYITLNDFTLNKNINAIFMFSHAPSGTQALLYLICSNIETELAKPEAKTAHIVGTVHDMLFARRARIILINLAHLSVIN